MSSSCGAGHSFKFFARSYGDVGKLTKVYPFSRLLDFLKTGRPCGRWVRTGARWVRAERKVAYIVHLDDRDEISETSAFLIPILGRYDQIKWGGGRGDV